MSTLKEDAKDVGLSLAFDLMLVAFVVCWIAAVLLAIFEISLWVVFGVFLLGCGIFFAMLYFSQKLEAKEKEADEPIESEVDQEKLDE
jgi:hypothetical protein